MILLYISPHALELCHYLYYTIYTYTNMKKIKLVKY